LDPTFARGLFTRVGVKIRLKDIKDGASNTLMLGETLPEERCDMNAWANFSAYGGWWTSVNGTGLGTTIIPINYVADYDPGSMPVGVTDGVGSSVEGAPPVPGCENANRNIYNWNVAFGFKSKHPGGANFVFADGSVHFLYEKINMGTFQYLGCRNDNQVLPTDW
jgi:prepilin-type processing-associated H-X9-DG protein